MTLFNDMTSFCIRFMLLLIPYYIVRMIISNEKYSCWELWGGGAGFVGISMGFVNLSLEFVAISMGFVNLSMNLVTISMGCKHIAGICGNFDGICELIAELCDDFDWIGNRQYRSLQKYCPLL